VHASSSTSSSGVFYTELLPSPPVAPLRCRRSMVGMNIQNFVLSLVSLPSLSVLLNGLAPVRPGPKEDFVDALPGGAVRPAVVGARPVGARKGDELGQLPHLAPAAAARAAHRRPVRLKAHGLGRRRLPRLGGPLSAPSLPQHPVRSRLRETLLGRPSPDHPHAASSSAPPEGQTPDTTRRKDPTTPQHRRPAQRLAAAARTPAARAAAQPHARARPRPCRAHHHHHHHPSLSVPLCSTWSSRPPSSSFFRPPTDSVRIPRRRSTVDGGGQSQGFRVVYFFSKNEKESRALLSWAFGAGLSGEGQS